MNDPRPYVAIFRPEGFSPHSGMEPIDELILPDVAAWRAWLDEHEDTTPDGVWLVLAKKNQPAPTTITPAASAAPARTARFITATSPLPSRRDMLHHGRRSWGGCG